MVIPVPPQGGGVERESGTRPEQCPLLYLPSACSAPKNVTGAYPWEDALPGKSQETCHFAITNRHPRDKDEGKTMYNLAMYEVQFMYNLVICDSLAES